MIAVEIKPEVIELPTYHSSGLTGKPLLKKLITKGVHVSPSIQLEIMDSESDVNESVTNEVEYQPVIIPARYFYDQEVSHFDHNKWLIPENHVYQQADELGFITPPKELGHLIALNPPFNHEELGDIQKLVIMSERNKDSSEMAISLKHIPLGTGITTYFETVRRGTIRKVRHIFAWEYGFVFLKAR